ncbi:MAG: leucine-rich repeat domain-containing protein [Ruminococcus sp.]|nr:leucine-rich repeat domain-containing protein [Ruminococcus sp.]
MARDTLVTGSKLTALANSIREKADISDSLTLDGMKTAVDNIQTGGDLELVKKLIERPSNIDLVIPEGVTSIGASTFYGFDGLKTVTIPESVEVLGQSSFINCSNLVTAYVNSKFAGNIMFSYPCQKLTTIVLGNTVTRINNRLAAGLSSLTTVNFPNSLTYINYPFYNCPNLEFITIENGFNCNGLDLSTSTKYSATTIVSWLNALADRTGQTAYTLTMGSTNLAKLTSDQIAIATNKNWNLL